MRGLNLLLVSALFILASCSSPFTELVVVVTADSSLLVPSDIDQLQVVLSPNAEMRENSFLTEAGALRDVPVTFGIRPTRAGGNAPITITVRGLRRGEIRTTRIVQTQFVEAERRYVVVTLQASCVGVVCAEDCDPAAEAGVCNAACDDGVCGPVRTQPATLVPSEWNDAGNLEFDAGVRPDAYIVDAGVDAPDAYVEPDAWPQSCTGTTYTEGRGAGGQTMPVRGIPTRPICVTPGVFPDGGLILTPDNEDPPRIYRWALHEPVIDTRNPSFEPYGFDLDGYRSDGLDTVAGECVRGIAAAPADAPAGVDNRFGQTVIGIIINTAAALGVADPELDMRRNMNAGTLAPVLSLANWNGEPYDTQVTAGLSFAVDVVPAAYTGGPPTTAGGISPMPLWDGTDRAFLQCSSLDRCSQGMASIDRPQIFDEGAYVADGYLVFSMSAGFPLPIPLGNGQGEFNIIGGRIIAHLGPNGTIDQPVRIVGRIQRQLFFRYLETLGFCPGRPFYDAIYNVVSGAVDQSLDLLARPNTPGDVQPQDAPCRAFSVMFLYMEASGVTATQSDITDVNALGNVCPDVPDAGTMPDGSIDASFMLDIGF